MRSRSALTKVAVSLAMIHLLAPNAIFADGRQPAIGNAPASAAARIHDVALSEGGTLSGQIVDGQGNARSAVSLRLLQQNKVVGAMVSNELGQFRATGLRGGIYRVESPSGVVVLRVWAPRTAPPAAKQQVLIVEGPPVVRGQFGGMGLRNLLANPYVVAGIVATAVAVPVALHNSNHDDGTSSP